MSRDALARGHIDAAPPAGGGAVSGFHHAAGVSRIKPADRPPHARGKPIAQTAHEGRAFPPMRSPANGVHRRCPGRRRARRTRAARAPRGTAI
ncbi:hypothetical protein BURPS668_0082 [Burkholderia pseudomallei 668]|nr:hypothetical protein BURPS668_0082 [Burkholderia pseudomallei 668]